MRRLAIWLASSSIALAACSSPGAEGPPTTPDAPGDTAVSTTTASEPTTSAVPDTTDAPAATDSGRPVAPDFSLELGDGGTYTLSDGAKPVYLVFWAEW